MILRRRSPPPRRPSPSRPPRSREITSKDSHGRIKPGALLVAETGTWRPTPTLTCRWLADGTAIEGATSEQFRLTGRWKGSEITVEVTAELEGYDRTTMRSAPVCAS